MMKITVDYEYSDEKGNSKNGKTLQLQIPDESDCFEFLDMMLRLGVMAGYEWNSMLGALYGLNGEYNQEDGGTIEEPPEAE